MPGFGFWVITAAVAPGLAPNRSGSCSQLKISIPERLNFEINVVKTRPSLN